MLCVVSYVLCVCAYSQLDNPTIRNVIVTYMDFADIEHMVEYPPHMKLTGDLPSLIKKRPVSAIDIYMLYLHSRFQCQKPVELLHFGEKLPVQLYAELSL